MKRKRAVDYVQEIELLQCALEACRPDKTEPQPVATPDTQPEVIAIKQEALEEAAKWFDLRDPPDGMGGGDYGYAQDELRRMAKELK